MVTSPRLSISIEIPSRPGAFPDFSSGIAVMTSSSERGEERSWSKRVVPDKVECGVIMGRSSMGMTSVLTWQFTTSWKHSAQQFNLSLPLCRVLLSLATRVDDRRLGEILCFAAQQQEPVQSVQLLLHVHSNKSYVPSQLQLW